MNSIGFRPQQLCSLIFRASSQKQRSYCVRTESQRQSHLFALEQKRQRDEIGRIQKIEVLCTGFKEDLTLNMNKYISTPYDCAKHFNEMIVKKSAVALLNGETAWHMHKPLVDSCKLEFLQYNRQQVPLVNKAFWRTCSFILGAVASQAFKDKIELHLHSFPIPNVKSGSFVYDIQLSINNWKPTQQELRVLSLETIKFCQEALPIECLDVSAELALLMFENNPHKTQQIPDIAAHNNGKVTLYKVGSHIDISKGPMVTNTSHLGRVTVTNVIKLNTDIPGGPIYRFQGVALPQSVILSHFAYAILEERARNLNPARIPGEQGVSTEDNTFVAQISQ